MHRRATAARTLSAALLALAGCVTEPPAPSAERAVLDAVVASLEGAERSSRVAVAPRTATMAPEWFPEIEVGEGASAAATDAVLWHRLARLTTTTRDIDARALPSRAWVLSPVLAAAFESHDASWRATFARAYLQLGGNAGVLRLSPVAFDGANALVYYEYRCGALCGHGVVARLVRLPDGRWRVRELRPLWAS